MSSPALVMLPGLLNDRRVFGPQIEALGGQVEILVPELWHEDTVGALAERVLDEAPDQFALAGFSMGGYVAFEILRRDAQRVTQLALIDTSARADSAGQRRRREQLIAQSRTAGTFKGVTTRLLPLLVHPDRLHDAPLVDLLQGMARAVGREGFIRQQHAILGRPDSRAMLGGIDVRVSVICGLDDALTPPEHSQEIAAAVADADLTLIEACGHVAPLERPGAVTEALSEWLML